MIRIDALWLSVVPLDMRAGMDTLLAQVMRVFCEAQPHHAYLWSYSVGAFDPIKAVVYDFAESRAGRHAQAFLDEWRGTLICDDYAG